MIARPAGAHVVHVSQRPDGRKDHRRPPVVQRPPQNRRNQLRIDRGKEVAHGRRLFARRRTRLDGPLLQGQAEQHVLGRRVGRVEGQRLLGEARAVILLRLVLIDGLRPRPAADQCVRGVVPAPDRDRIGVGEGDAVLVIALGLAGQGDLGRRQVRFVHAEEVGQDARCPAAHRLGLVRPRQPPQERHGAHRPALPQDVKHVELQIRNVAVEHGVERRQRLRPQPAQGVQQLRAVLRRPGSQRVDDGGHDLAAGAVKLLEGEIVLLRLAVEVLDEELYSFRVAQLLFDGLTDEVDELGGVFAGLLLDLGVVRPFRDGVQREERRHAVLVFQGQQLLLRRRLGQQRVDQAGGEVQPADFDFILERGPVFLGRFRLLEELAVVVAPVGVVVGRRGGGRVFLGRRVGRGGRGREGEQETDGAETQERMEHCAAILIRWVESHTSTSGRTKSSNVSRRRMRRWSAPSTSTSAAPADCCSWNSSTCRRRRR